MNSTSWLQRWRLKKLKQHTIGGVNARCPCVVEHQAATNGEIARALGGRSSKARLNLNGSRSHPLQRYCALIALTAWFALIASVALANCKEEVQHLRQDINHEPSPYTADSRQQAQKELARAEAALLRAECREYLDRARQALKKK